MKSYEEQMRAFLACHTMFGHKGVRGICPRCGSHIEQGSIRLPFNILKYPELFKEFKTHFRICGADLSAMAHNRFDGRFRIKEEQ